MFHFITLWDQTNVPSYDYEFCSSFFFLSCEFCFLNILTPHPREFWLIFSDNLPSRRTLCKLLLHHARIICKQIWLGNKLYVDNATRL